MRNTSRNTLFVLGFLLFSCTQLCAKEASAWPKIWDSRLHKFIQEQDLAAAMKQATLAFVGEQHTHTWGHRVERQLFRLFHSQHGDQAALGLEMFERDVQNLLDGYLKGQLTESFLIAAARPWPNYTSDYRGLLWRAKEHKLRVLGLNVPRRYAGFVAQGKDTALFAMPDLEKSYLAESILAEPGKYRDKFYAVMSGHVPPEQIERYYRAQCLKDDTMARSLAEFLAKNASAKVMTIAGAFHTDESLGLVAKAKLRMPQASALVLSIVPIAPKEPLAPEKHEHLADIVIFAPEDPSGDGLHGDRSFYELGY